MASYYQHNGVLGNLVMVTDLFVLPLGWKQISTYTALNGITGKLLHCVTVSLCGVLYMTTLIGHLLAACANFIAINASKPPGLLHMVTTSLANISSVPGQSVTSKPEKFSFMKGVDYNFEEPKYSMVLNAQPVGVPLGGIDSTMIDHHGVLISCEEHFFKKWINYSAKYFQNVFPFYTCSWALAAAKPWYLPM